MKIGIIGGGSIGLLFAGYLSKNNDVTVYTRTNRQATSLNKDGLTLVVNKTEIHGTVKALPLDYGLQNEDMVILAVKQYDLEKVLSTMDIQKISTLLFLQNGMGHIPLLQKLKNENILIGIVEHGALKESDTRVIHSGIGVTKISPFKGLIQEFTSFDENFPVLIKDTWHGIMTSKLIANAVINPLTAVFRIENGELVSNSYFNKTMKELFNEVISVVQISDQEEMWKQVTQICMKTAANRSSMLRDVEEKRQTEVDAILGYIMEEANQKDTHIPITSFLYQAIKGIESRILLKE